MRDEPRSLFQAGELGVSQLLRCFKRKIVVTWVLVLLENVLIALIPLFMGIAIDGLLGEDPRAVWLAAVALAGVTVIGVIRRVYDTRAYGTIRVHLGAELARRNAQLPVSRLSARVDMGRELVDFLEGDIPQIFTAFVQMIVSVIVLIGFELYLGLTAGVALLCTMLIYGACERRFFLGNQRINERREEQVAVLTEGRPDAIHRYLSGMRKWEIKLSDLDAGMYGTIFLLMSAFVLGNIAIAATLTTITVGTMFAIVSYSWEFVESSFQLPMTLQQWTRLREITARVNGQVDGADESPDEETG